MHPLVSVLVTVYNREKYLAESIESILNSTCTDFEVIVVDDNSADSSFSIAQAVAKNDKRIKVFKNETNLGQFENRSKAASLAKGKFIKYMDSDDIIYPHSMKLMVEAMKEYPEAGLALSHSEAEDESPYPWMLSPDQAYRKHFLGRGCLSCGPSSAIIRRDHYQLIGGFDSSWGVLADTELWVRIAAKWPIVLLPPGLVWWRRHEDQDFTRGDAATIYLKRGFEMEMAAISSADCPLTDSERAEAARRCRQHFSRRLLSMGLRDRKAKTALKLFRESDLSFADLVKGFNAYA